MSLRCTGITCRSVDDDDENDDDASRNPDSERPKQGLDMSLCDYDGRTALHLAAAEGQLPCVEVRTNNFVMITRIMMMDNMTM